MLLRGLPLLFHPLPRGLPRRLRLTCDGNLPRPAQLLGLCTLDHGGAHPLSPVPDERAHCPGSCDGGGFQDRVLVVLGLAPRRDSATRMRGSAQDSNRRGRHRVGRKEAMGSLRSNPTRIGGVVLGAWATPPRRGMTLKVVERLVAYRVHALPRRASPCPGHAGRGSRMHGVVPHSWSFWLTCPPPSISCRRVVKCTDAHRYHHRSVSPHAEPLPRLYAQRYVRNHGLQLPKRFSHTCSRGATRWGIRGTARCRNRVSALPLSRLAGPSPSLRRRLGLAC